MKFSKFLPLNGIKAIVCLVLLFYFLSSGIMYVFLILLPDSIVLKWKLFIPLVPVLIYSASITRHFAAFEGLWVIKRNVRVILTFCWRVVLINFALNFLALIIKRFNLTIPIETPFNVDSLILSCFMALCFQGFLYFAFGRNEKSLWNYKFPT